MQGLDELIGEMVGTLDALPIEETAHLEGLARELAYCPAERCVPGDRLGRARHALGHQRGRSTGRPVPLHVVALTPKERLTSPYSVRSRVKNEASACLCMRNAPSAAITKLRVGKRSRTRNW